MLTSRAAQWGQNGRGGKYAVLQESQRCRRNSPARVPSQKCNVSGVGCGRARCPSGIPFVSSPDCTRESLTRALRCGKQVLLCTAQERAPMITPSYVRTMAAYNAEMNQRLYDAAKRLTDSERRAPRGAFWHSIHGTLVHILWGDSQWMSRFDDWKRPATPIKESDHFIEDWAELCAAREKGDSDISRWAGAVDEALLDADL